ncbi:hypothetical protein PVAP13_5NG140762 [Panicum virgatum]|uniref:Uncharacterized protein n=1 Tax=Panicum virgatum TaxID=38727 RepID=A0A8T0RQU0_PANVG|nr:hypothetical protein PVAP13_5NG140762 [Panicum virgatum]
MPRSPSPCACPFAPEASLRCRVGGGAGATACEPGHLLRRPPLLLPLPPTLLHPWPDHHSSAAPRARRPHVMEILGGVAGPAGRGQDPRWAGGVVRLAAAPAPSDRSFPGVETRTASGIRLPLGRALPTASGRHGDARSLRPSDAVGPRAGSRLWSPRGRALPPASGRCWADARPTPSLSGVDLASAAARTSSGGSMASLLLRRPPTSLARPPLATHGRQLTSPRRGGLSLLLPPRRWPSRRRSGLVPSLSRRARWLGAACLGMR